MTKSLRGSAYAIIVPVGFAVTAGLLIATLAAQPRKPDETAWAEYRILLVDRTAEITRVHQALEESGLTGIVSWAVQHVHVSLFDSVERVGIARLPDRLERLDPRFDPYMERLGSYYTAHMDGVEWHVLYLPVHMQPLRLWWQLRGVLDPLGFSWHLLSFTPWHVALAGGCFVALAILVAWKLGGSWIYGASGVFWLPNLAGGSVETYVGAAVVFAATVLLLREVEPYVVNRFIYGWKRRDPRALELRLLYVAVALGCAVTFPAVMGAPAAFPLLLSFAGSAAWISAAWAFRIIRAKQAEHIPFTPVPIRRRADRVLPSPLGGPILRAALVAILLAPVLAVAVSDGLPAAAVPRPASENATGDLSWANLQRLWWSSTADPMPNLADYLAHRAYQDGIAFGRAYAFPRIGEEIELSEYRFAGDGIEQSYRVVFSYSTQWYDQVLQEARDLGIESVLLLQGHATPVMLDRVQSLPDALASALAICLFGVLALLPPALAPRRGQARIVHRMRGTSFRRKKQAA